MSKVIRNIDFANKRRITDQDLLHTLSDQRFDHALNDAVIAGLTETIKTHLEIARAFLILREEKQRIAMEYATGERN